VGIDVLFLRRQGALPVDEGLLLRPEFLAPGTDPRLDVRAFPLQPLLQGIKRHALRAHRLLVRLRFGLRQRTRRRQGRLGLGNRCRRQRLGCGKRELQPLERLGQRSLGRFGEGDLLDRFGRNLGKGRSGFRRDGLKSGDGFAHRLLWLRRRLEHVRASAVICGEMGWHPGA
jgi:hypothetical protein